MRANVKMLILPPPPKKKEMGADQDYHNFQSIVKINWEFSHSLWKNKQAKQCFKKHNIYIKNAKINVLQIKQIIKLKNS